MADSIDPETQRESPADGASNHPMMQTDRIRVTVQVLVTPRPGKVAGLAFMARSATAVLRLLRAFSVRSLASGLLHRQLRWWI